MDMFISLCKMYKNVGMGSLSVFVEEKYIPCHDPE